MEAFPLCIDRHDYSTWKHEGQRQAAILSGLMAEARRGRDLLLLIGYFLLTTNQSPLHEGEIINSRSKIANNKQSLKLTFLSVPSKDKIDNASKRSWLGVPS
jgi:hypothetical protein